MNDLSCTQTFVDDKNWNIPSISQLPEGWPGDTAQGLSQMAKWSWWGT